MHRSAHHNLFLYMYINMSSNKIHPSNPIKIAYFIAFLSLLSILCWHVYLKFFLSTEKRIELIIDELTVSPKRGEAAILELEVLGKEDVPYLVSHLGDTRQMAETNVGLTNTYPGAFERKRQYGAEIVHDAILLILDNITGETSYLVAINSGSIRQRIQATHQPWISWCIKNYPTKKAICEKQMAKFGKENPRKQYVFP